MYAIKDAMIAKEHAGGDLDCAIFNMDIRTFGKDYEKYYLRAKDKAGVRFINARVHTIDEIGENNDLRLQYVDTSGKLHEEIFDMVVLSVGLQIAGSTADLANRLNVDLNKYNFAVTEPFDAGGNIPPRGLCLRCVSRNPKIFRVPLPKQVLQRVWPEAF